MLSGDTDYMASCYNYTCLKHIENKKYKESPIYKQIDYKINAFNVLLKRIEGLPSVKKLNSMECNEEEFNKTRDIINALYLLILNDVVNE